MLQNTFWKTASALTVAFVSGSLVVIVWKKLKFHQQIKPDRWIKVGTISELIIYPVKSCRGVVVEKAAATEIGFKATNFIGDRTFSIVNPHGEVLRGFQRMSNMPKLIKIIPKFTEDTLTLSGPCMEPLAVRIPQESPVTRRSCSYVKLLREDSY